MKPFILLTTGRTGSTALMDALAGFEDIAVPARQIESKDNELLHPEHVRRYRAFYQRFAAQPIRHELDLINAFYRANQHAAFAGFKSMPNRHRKLRALVAAPGLQVITLDRYDLASTVASFIVAADYQTWRREGGEQHYRFTFENEYRQRALDHLTYVVTSRWVLERIPGAIHLSYEDLCSTDFQHQQLNAYFNRAVALECPRTPTVADHYVTNWDSFSSFIDEQHERILDRLKQQAPGTPG